MVRIFILADLENDDSQPERRFTARTAIRLACASTSLIIGLALFWNFRDSHWGKWPWYFSLREPGFDLIELVVLLIMPLALANILAMFSGRARSYLLVLHFGVLLLSLF